MAWYPENLQTTLLRIQVSDRPVSGHAYIRYSKISLILFPFKICGKIWPVLFNIYLLGPHRSSQSSKATEDQESFFRERPLPQSSSHLTVHDLSSTTFNTSDINLLSKGLTFSPTPQYTNTDLLQFLPNH